MVENIEKAMVRGQKLQLLEERTEDLQAAAHQFQKQVGAVVRLAGRSGGCWVDAGWVGVGFGICSRADGPRSERNINPARRPQTRQGRAIRKTLWWQNVKVKVAIFTSVFLILAIIIVVLACLSGGNRCVPKKQQER
jgi:hypothetical protein